MLLFLLRMCVTCVMVAMPMPMLTISCLVCGLMSLSPAMVMLRMSVNLRNHTFPGQA